MQMKVENKTARLILWKCTRLILHDSTRSLMQDIRGCWKITE